MSVNVYENKEDPIIYTASRTDLTGDDYGNKRYPLIHAAVKVFNVEDKKHFGLRFFGFMGKETTEEEIKEVVDSILEKYQEDFGDKSVLIYFEWENKFYRYLPKVIGNGLLVPEYFET